VPARRGFLAQPRWNRYSQASVTAKENMLSNREFSALVEKGVYPEQVLVPLDQPFLNENGSIQNLLLEKFTSVALIESATGAVRANHFHKTDWHYSYVVRGQIWYYWRKAGSKTAPREEQISAGMMFFTPPLVEHAMFFPEETVFLTLAKNIRDQAHHEEDVVRVKLIEVVRDPGTEVGWKIRPAES
jgi:dTDP-4-dehydrorhamnose 3,5-epimerase-like enzyme